MPVFNHSITITRGGVLPGEQDEDTGSYVPDDDDPAAVWSGKGFFLDEGVEIAWTAGVPTITADGQVFLPRKTVAKAGVRDGDHVKVEYPNGDTKHMDIRKAVRATDILYVIRA
jgi:hypothetical protein